MRKKTLAGMSLKAVALGAVVALTGCSAPPGGGGSSDDAVKGGGGAARVILPASSVNAKASSFNPHASLTHRQNEPQRVRQTHETMRRVEAGCRLVQRVDDHH